MSNSTASAHTQNECRRLQQQVERDGGLENLSQTDRAFFQTYCSIGSDDLGKPQDVNFHDDSAIDESAHLHESTIFGDPNAGRPDDAADANPAAPDPAITKQ